MPEPNAELRAARQRARLSRSELAEAVAIRVYQRTDREAAIDGHYVAKLERGAIRWPGQHYRAALRDVLDAATDAALGFRPPRADPAWMLVPDGVDGADALELVNRLTASDVSAATLELLARRVNRLCRDYPVRPAPELLAESRGWLDRSLELLERRTSLAAHRELLVSAGWLSALVACLYYDRGQVAGARTWQAVTGQLGTESGHTEITGWSHEIAAWMTLTAGPPTEALIQAEAGQRIDGTSWVAAQLAAQEARAAAKLGDRATAEAAMARGRRVLDRLPDPTYPDHHFVIDPAKADFYAVDVYRWLGADDQAEAFAERVRAYSERPDGTIRSPMRRSEALLTLGVVAARRGEPDAAVAYGVAGLDNPRKSAPSLLSVAADLDAELAARSGEAAAAPWRDAVGALRRPGPR